MSSIKARYIMDYLKKYKTLSQILRFRKNSRNGIFFIENSNQEKFLSYEELYNKAIIKLSYLQEKGIKPQNELVFQIDDNEVFIVLFWACILGGIIPVPISIGRNSEHKQKLFNIWPILNDPYLVISNDDICNLKSNNQDDKLIEIEKKTISIEDLSKEGKKGVIHNAKEDDIAFIQFSSGSTGNPKGVVLTHKNLLTNILDISTASNYTEEDKTISWMPLTHDMGLIGFHLNPLFVGMNHYLMPTDLFVRRPSIWLEKTSENGISILCSPNFGYKYVMKHCKLEDIKNLDLSCVRLIYNGAEPISEKIANQFLTSLASYGLKKSAMCPVYGLAEASLAVTISNLNDEIIAFHFDRDKLKIGDSVLVTTEQDKKSVSFVKVGKPINRCSLRITNEENQIVKDEVIGHIQIKGPNVTSSYYNNEEATKNTILEDGWVKTGDLGFIKDKELYVTGRVKDIIFSNGQNYYPHDIERVAEKVEGIELNKIVVVGFFNGNTQKEEIIAFVFHRGNLDKFIPIAHALKEVINLEIGIEINNVIPIKNIPKTTSGKLQRFKLLTDYRAGFFKEVAQKIQTITLQKGSENFNPPVTEHEIKLHAIWKKVLELENISIEKSFFEAGGNSLKAAEMIMALVKEFQVEVTFDILYKYQTIKSLSSVLMALKPKEYHAIPKSNNMSVYPVSNAQKRLYYAWKMNKNSVAYNMPIAFKIEGNINLEKLQGVIDILIERHDSLRITFDEMPSPIFITNKISTVPVSIRNCEYGHIETELQNLIQPFNLNTEPLFRITILNTEKRGAILFLDFHHSISDGISIHNFVKEIVTLYEDKALDSLHTSYGDYSNWEKNYKNEKDFTSNKSYWLNQLKGTLPELKLELDYSRPPIFIPIGEKIEYEFDSEITIKLKKLAKEQECTLHVLMFTLYHLLLAKYSGVNETLIGIPVSGRIHPDVQDVHGMFVNNLPIRNTIKEKETFTEILCHVNKTIANGLLHQDYPFDEMVNNTLRTNDVSRNPIFDTMFIYQNMGPSTIASTDFTLSKHFLDPRYSKFDLSMEVFEMDQLLKYSIEYNTKLFKRNTMLNFQECFENLVKQILKQPDISYAKLSLLSQEKTNELTYLFNNTEKSYPKEKSVYHLFEEQAQKTPNAIALEFGVEKMTYRELNSEVKKYASLLKQKGIEPQTIVSILLPRSFELVISILSVMKVGGIYIPLDIDLPENRIDYIIKDSKSKYLITSSKMALVIKASGKIKEILTITIDNEYNEEFIYFDSDIKYHAQNPAYILYTSGTSGKPKGVVIKNASLTNYIHWAAKTYIKGESVRFALYTSISFDLTITSIFTPLITGNSIIIYAEEKQEILIEKVINDAKANIIKLTPSHLKIIRELNIQKPYSIKRFIIGGEELESSLANDIYNLFEENVELYNEYGPTEATVGCMVYKFTPNDNFRTVPIGNPIVNTQIYLLDTYMRPVPIGVRGDLYISGEGLAQGYFNNELLTNEKFIENPFLKGYKMYRSGDIAVRRINGLLEYIGRSDQQIKINGYRIEISEIENCLLNHPNVKQAVVVCIQDSYEESALHAYYKSDENQIINDSDLITFLATYLPYYMIPRSYTYIENVPLTKNGKIDYKLLPEPKIKKNNQKERTSINSMEEVILEVWQEVFGKKDITIYDNFFELGGDSIKAVQISSQLNTRGITIEVKNILTYQTVEIIAPYAHANLEIKKYEQGFVKGSKMLSPIEHWFVNQKLANPNYYNQSVLLNFNDAINSNILKQTFIKLINHHDGLRMNYEKNGNKLFFNDAHINHSFKIEKYNVKDDNELIKVCTHIKNSIEIEFDLLIKVAIIIYPDASEKLLITAHHLIIDGISWRILLNDFQWLYKSLLENKERSLPKKTMSIKEWQVTLENLIQETNFTEEELTYWQDIDSINFQLPYDTETKDWGFASSRQITTSLNKEQTEHLLKKAHLLYKTNTLTLLSTALSIALQKWTNKEAFIVQYENHGRHLSHTDVSRTIGWFTAMYPVRLKLANGTIDHQIKSIKEQLASVPNNGLGYGIWKYMKSEKWSNRDERSEIRFNYLGQFNQELNNELFEFSSVPHGNEMAPENKLTTKLEINAMVVQEVLQISVNYNSEFHKKETISRFLNSFLESLELLIVHTKNQKEIHFTPSDFETIKLEQEELDSLFS